MEIIKTVLISTILYFILIYEGRSLLGIKLSNKTVFTFSLINILMQSALFL